MITMAIYALGDKKPKIDETAYVHPQASIIGDVTIGKRVFVAPMVSIRGDRGPIVIGDETNFQDGTVVHSTNTYTTTIGNRVNIGHNATIHAKTVGDNAAIGMGAVLMVGSVVAEHALIANGALLTAKTVTEPNNIYAGVPAKMLREMMEDDPARNTIDIYLDSYIRNAVIYPKELQRLD